MTDDINDTALRLATLELLLAALDPNADDTEFVRVVSNMLEPIVAEDGTVWVDAGRLRDILQGAVAEARALLPEQLPEVEQAIDAGFEAIADEVDRLTRPKTEH